MPRPAICTSRRCSPRRRGGCCGTTASAAWRPSSPATGSTSAGSRSTTRRSRAVPDLHERAAAGDVRGADPLLHGHRSARIGSVLDFLYGDHTFVNAGPGQALRHAASRRRGRLGRASTTRAKYGRGGLLPMAVFLTKNAPGLRTSPVKRGYWVVRRLLGEHIPAPPPNVPELPTDEAKLGDLTLPQTLAQHRENKSCAGCHASSTRSAWSSKATARSARRAITDLGGRPVETTATFPDGSDGSRPRRAARVTCAHERQDEFVDNLCRKLLAYALGRSLLLSDEPLLDDMQQGSGGRRLPLRQPGRDDRHQPAVPEQTRDAQLREGTAR